MKWHDHLIEMPGAVGASTPAANIGSDGGPELVRPAAHDLVGGVDATFGEHLFDIAQAHRESEIEPYSQADRIGRKAVPLVGYRFHHPLLTETG